MTQQILIVDDEPDIRGLLSITVKRMGFQAVSVGNLQKAYKSLCEQPLDLCLTDLKLPDGSGIDLVKHIQSSYSNTPVIVITAHGSMDVAIEAMKLGAFDFINKPVNLDSLRSTITNAVKVTEIPHREDIIADIIGTSPAIMRMKEKIAKVARSQAPVFISGESGSGKELTARAIHDLSSRRQKPFIAVNCGAIPKELMESEFFGHKKGSFTSAHQDKMGLFESAQGGTLFLDEVADLPMDMQVKLLRVIQEKTVRAVGSQQEETTDVRILSATHKDLLNAIENGEFRNDLYYRINVIELTVPSLRQRKQDIEQLATVLLQKIADKNQTAPIAITREALKLLETYEFPGNVRELENILERACALCGTQGINSSDLQLPSSQHGAQSIAPLQVTAQATASSQANSPSRAVTPPAKMTPTESAIAQLPLDKETFSPSESDYQPETEALDEYLEKLERGIILRHLELNRWKQTMTAKVLGISLRSLRYRMKKLDIEDEQ